MATAAAAAEQSLAWFESQVRRPAARKRTGLVYDDRFLNHLPSENSIYEELELPTRVEAIMHSLRECGYVERMIHVASALAEDCDLELMHSKDHIAQVKSLQSAHTRQELLQVMRKKSLFASEGTVEASLLSAGSVIKALERLSAGDIDNALCVVRPPGHHSERDEMQGFCFFDNVAVAASVAVHRLQYKRVLVLDWDVHHGNGIQHAFADNDQVLYISIHRWDQGEFYPGGMDAGPQFVGRGKGRGYNINVAWNGVGPFGDEEYMHCFDRIVLPAVSRFQPDVILVAAGFDASLGDPLGRCCVSPQGFGRMLSLLGQFAEGKVCVVLEGGYELVSLSCGMLCCAAVLLGDPLPHTGTTRAPSHDALKAIRRTIDFHSGLTNVAFSQQWTNNSLATTAKEASRIAISLHCPGQFLSKSEEDYLQRNIKLPPSSARRQYGEECESCKTRQDCFVCIKCYSTHCSAHAAQHAMVSKHSLAIKLSTLGFWDLSLNAKVHSGNVFQRHLRPVLDYFHQVKFNAPLPEPHTCS